jgi:multiple sugar transport system substrate-binding protein
MTQPITRRRAVTEVAAVGGGLALAACGAGGSAGGDQRVTPSLGPATITASNWVDQSAAVQAYMQEFPQIKVDYTPNAFAAHYEKAQASAVGGTPIDALWLHDAYVTQFVASGLVRSIDDYLRRERDAIEDIFPVALKYHTRNGKLYGIPQNLSVYVVY